MSVDLPPVTRLRVLDVIRLGTVGVRVRPVRTVLAALGIAIGIAALISVIGIPASNQAAVRAELAALGPNLLTVTPGNDITTGKKATLPAESLAMVRRVGAVQSVTAIGDTSAKVYRTDLVPAGETGGLSVAAARLDLLDVLHARVRAGSFLNPATAQYPVAVLGSRAAQILGIEPSPDGPAPRVWIGNQWFGVVGVLDQLPLAPQVDYAALVGWPAAHRYLVFAGTPGTIFVRADGAAVDDVRAVLGRTVNPQRPDQVLVSRPSDALAAQRLVERAYATLFLGLGAVALLVGGIGVANTMVISVLERRREIGLRRALGASRRQVAGQFLAESVLLAGLGGGLGGLLGTAVTAGFSAYQRWPAVLPVSALLGAGGVAIAIGVLAGVYPAVRAARLTPTEALSST
jgi:putative ABC transport system permease protein